MIYEDFFGLLYPKWRGGKQYNKVMRILNCIYGVSTDFKEKETIKQIENKHKIRFAESYIELTLTYFFLAPRQQIDIVANYLPKADRLFIYFKEAALENRDLYALLLTNKIGDTEEDYEIRLRKETSNTDPDIVNPFYSIIADFLKNEKGIDDIPAAECTEILY